MTIRSTFGAAVAAVITMAGGPLAGPAVGVDGLGNSQIEFETPAVFDFSRVESTVEGGVVSETHVVHDAGGRIHGTIVDQPAGGGEVLLRTAVSGVVRTVNGVTIVRQRLRGLGMLGNKDTIRSLGVSTARMEGWGPAARLVGTLRMRTCARFWDPISERYRGRCDSGSLPLNLAYTDAGTWRVSVALEHSGARIFGAGSITTSAKIASLRKTQDVEVSGRWDGRDEAIIKLAPMQAGGFGPVVLRAAVREEASGALVVTAVREVRGRILGQAFNEVVE